MKKKQKINKAVNYGELVLLGLTALFLCVLFALRDRPAAVTALPQPRDAPANPDGTPGSTSARPDGAPAADSPPATAAPDSMPARPDGAPGSTPANPDSAPATPAPVDTATPSAPDNAGRVNINTADLAALCALPGIGEALAGRVIEYREAHGPFASPDEIMNVSGIGAGKFAAIEGMIATE